MDPELNSFLHGLPQFPYAVWGIAVLASASVASAIARLTFGRGERLLREWARQQGWLGMWFSDEVTVEWDHRGADTPERREPHV